jgi:hypothetical protein
MSIAASRAPDRRSHTAAFLFTVLALELCAAPALLAQARHGMTDLSSITRVVDSMAPRSGPVGTDVNLRAMSMPAITPVRLGFGAATGFEELGMLLTTETGVLTVGAKVPEWATWDRSYRFIVFDVYFRPIALSDPFYVTSQDGMVLREGTVRRPATSCVTLTQMNGETITLVGDTASLTNDVRVAVEGTVVGPTAAPCPAGVTIRITRVRPRGAPPR